MAEINTRFYCNFSGKIQGNFDIYWTSGISTFSLGLGIKRVL